jgi:hypothetical protein
MIGAWFGRAACRQWPPPIRSSNGCASAILEGCHNMPVKKTPDRTKLDPGKKARRMARTVIGTVPMEKVIVPRTLRKKPKHKKQDELTDLA